MLTSVACDFHYHYQGRSECWHCIHKLYPHNALYTKQAFVLLLSCIATRRRTNNRIIQRVQVVANVAVSVSNVIDFTCMVIGQFDI